jgi:FkbM family methyltransferase
MKPKGLFFREPLEANFWGHIMEEVYKTGLFESVLPKNKENSVVIDCGANVGITAYYFSSRFGKVYSIEPTKEHFDVLQYMLDYNEIKNVYPFQFALSMHDKKDEQIFHYNNKTMHSLYGNLQGPNLVMTGTEAVELKRLDTFIKEQKIEHVDLLKVDVEGVEYEILCGDSFSNVADKIDTVVCEIHSYSGRNPNQIIQALKLRGFTVEVIPHDATLVVARK